MFINPLFYAYDFKGSLAFYVLSLFFSVEDHSEGMSEKLEK